MNDQNCRIMSMKSLSKEVVYITSHILPNFCYQVACRVVYITSHSLPNFCYQVPFRVVYITSHILPNFCYQVPFRVVYITSHILSNFCYQVACRVLTVRVEMTVCTKRAVILPSYVQTQHTGTWSAPNHWSSTRTHLHVTSKT